MKVIFLPEYQLRTTVVLKDIRLHFSFQNLPLPTHVIIIRQHTWTRMRQVDLEQPITIKQYINTPRGFVYKHYLEACECPCAKLEVA